MAADPEDIATEAWQASLELLERLRRETIGAILSAPEPISASLRQVLAEIDGLIVTYRQSMTSLMTQTVDAAARAGDQQAIDDVTTPQLAMPASYYGVSDTLIRLAGEYTADLIRGVSEDARSAIARDVRLAAAGGMSTTDLIDRLGRNLRDRSTFTTIAARAEAIARTEVSRVYSMSYAEQATEIATRHAGMRKRWVHAGFGGNSRPDHVRMAALTSENPIPVDDPFVFPDGVSAMHPHDPLMPASHVVHCRCRMQLVTPEPEDVEVTVELEQPATDASKIVPEFRNAKEAALWAAENLQTSIQPFTRIDLATARDVFTVIQDIERRLDGPIPTPIKFGGVKGRARATHAVNERTREAVLHFRTDYTNVAAEMAADNETWRKRYGPDVPFVAAPTLEGLIWHEVGHALDYASGWSLASRIRAISLEDKRQLGRVSGYSMENFFTSDKYAGTEAFAESLAAIMTGSDRAPFVPDSVRAIVETAVKK
jgi:hypothetical protein